MADRRSNNRSRKKSKDAYSQDYSNSYDYSKSKYSSYSTSSSGASPQNNRPKPNDNDSRGGQGNGSRNDSLVNDRDRGLLNKLINSDKNKPSPNYRPPQKHIYYPSKFCPPNPFNCSPQPNIRIPMCNPISLPVFGPSLLPFGQSQQSPRPCCCICPPPMNNDCLTGPPFISPNMPSQSMQPTPMYNNCNFYQTTCQGVSGNGNWNKSRNKAIDDNIRSNCSSSDNGSGAKSIKLSSKEGELSGTLSSLSEKVTSSSSSSSSTRNSLS